MLGIYLHCLKVRVEKYILFVCLYFMKMKVKSMAVAGYESKSRSGCRLNRALGTFKFISLAPFQSRVTNLESCA